MHKKGHQETYKLTIDTQTTNKCHLDTKNTKEVTQMCSTLKPKIMNVSHLLDRLFLQNGFLLGSGIEKKPEKTLSNRAQILKQNHSDQT